MSDIFAHLVYIPLYNGLVFLIDILPGADVGLAIVILTVLVKFALSPLSLNSIKAQISLRSIQPEMEEIKKKYKEDKQKQALKMMELYKERNINPLSGLFSVLIQIPIVITLYYIVFHGGLPEINTEIVYNFIPVPLVPSMNFLGLVDISARSLWLAVFAGVSQYFQVKASLPQNPQKEKKAQDKKSELKEDLQKSMMFNMRFVLPAIIFFVAYTLPAAIALYFTTSNIFALSQEIFVKRKYREKMENAQQAKNNGNG